MTIEEIQEKKQLLESTLLELIHGFEEETTCHIESINLMRSSTIANRGLIIQVTCEVKL